MNFYQKQGINESDFILEFAWLSRENEELVPKAFTRVFNTINMSIPIPHTSTLFEARSITNLRDNRQRSITNGDKITINHVTYTRIYGIEFRAVMHLLDFWIDPLTRYIPMNRLILCNRVSLSLSELIMSNGSFYRHSGDAALTLPEDYIITGNSIEMCADEYFNRISYALTSSDKDGNALDITVDIAVILSFVCSCVSIVCLLITIVTYLLFEPLRTLPGKINLCLCVSLLIAQILQQFTIDVTEYETACIIFGALIHFTWSATLFWMSASSFNLFRCFSPSNLGRRGFKPSLGLYAIYVISMSALLVVANIGYNFLRDGSVGYGKRICYISSTIGLLITFVSPVGVVFLTNTCFLSVTIWRISHTPKPESSKSADRNNVLIYIKMSTLTGTCWIFGFLRILTNVDVFEILFIIANASQGLFITMSFVCNRRVLAMFKELMSGARESNNWFMALTWNAQSLYEPRHDQTNKVTVRPAKTQISLGIRPVWSEFSLSAWRKLGSLASHWAHSQDSDQTGRMLRLIWVVAWHTVTLLVLSCRGSYIISNGVETYSYSTVLRSRISQTYPTRFRISEMGSLVQMFDTFDRGFSITYLRCDSSLRWFMKVKKCKMLIVIETSPGLATIAGWVPLPISMVLRSERSVKS